MQIRSNILAPLLIAVVGIIAYANSFSGTFLLDDSGWLVKNMQEPELVNHITHSTRPLTALSFFLNYRMSGKNAADYHAINLLIHIWAGLLLYGIIRRTLKLKSGINQSTGIQTLILPFFAAVIWVAHPLQTESVTYIVQRAESMMGLFYLMTLYLTIRGISSEKQHLWFVGAVAACLFGMLTKPIMVTAPIMILLYDRTFAAGSFQKALKLRLGLYAGLAATWAVAAFLVLSPNESSSTTGLSVESITPLKYLAVQPGVIIHYLKLIVWPDLLCLDYAWPPATQIVNIITPLLLLIPLILLSGYLLWKKLPGGFCPAWFFIILAPSSTLIPVADFAVEHRLYLSLAGPAVLFTAAVIHLSELGRNRKQRTATLISVAILSAVTSALVYRTILRNRVYISQEAFSRSIIHISPHNFRAKTMLIEALTKKLKFEEAEKEASQLIIDLMNTVGSGDPQYSVSASRHDLLLHIAYSQHGMVLLHLDRAEDALPEFQKSLALRPDYHIAQYLLATAYMGLEQYQKALAAAERAIRLKPGSSSTLTLTGVILIKLERTDDAVTLLEQALSINPCDVTAGLELSWLLSTSPAKEKRNGSRALELIQNVERLSNGCSYRVMDAAAAAYAACGDFKTAAIIAEKALKAAESKTGDGIAEPDSKGAVPSTPDGIRERMNFYRSKKIWTSP